jgi:hypothetical protein
MLKYLLLIFLLTSCASFNESRVTPIYTEIKNLKEITFVAKYPTAEDKWHVEFSNEPIDSCYIASSKIGFAAKNGNNKKIKVGYSIGENIIYIDSKPGVCDSGAPIFVIRVSNNNYTGTIHTYTISGGKSVGEVIGDR